MLYVNERMQHSLIQLTERPADSPVVVDRFSRDVQLLKRNLGEIRENLGKSTRPRRNRAMLEQVDKLYNEVIRSGPLIEQVMEGSADYLDFLQQHARLQELLEQATQLLDKLDAPPEQVKT
jgi:hypothetical protein